MPSASSIVPGTSLDPSMRCGIDFEDAGHGATELVAHVARRRPVLDVDDRLVIGVQEQMSCGTFAARATSSA